MIFQTQSRLCMIILNNGYERRRALKVPMS